MADDASAASSLIAGRFAVDPSATLPDAGGGLPAYLARDRQAADAGRTALLVSRQASPRLAALEALADPIDNLMTPLGHGPGPAPGGHGEAYYIITAAPPGPPLSRALQPWSEKALIDQLLLPVARVLVTLHDFNLTHRSIRLNNVFQSAAGQPVTLGAAWAAPAAMHQPALFESPYQAMCHPAGRGTGSIGDDVYALGVMLLVMAGGKLPFAGQDEQSIIRWKLELGSFAALTRDLQLSGFLSDLLRGMLVDDADHRPLPSLLLDPTAARARRVAAKPARHSQRPLAVNDIPAFEAHTLAFALSLDEKKAVQALRSDMVTTWLRRGLGDAGLASRLEELVRERVLEARLGPRSDALLVMRGISLLNSRMPLCWRGVSLAPDGLDGLLTQAVAEESDLKAIVTEMMVNDIVDEWSAQEFGGSAAEKPPLSRDVAQQRRYLQNEGPGALLRLYYTLNPMLPCRLDKMAAAWILSMADLMRFLEKTAETSAGDMIDGHLAAFIAARSDGTTEVQVNNLLGRDNPNAHRLGELRLLRDLQTRHYPHPLPALATWAAARLGPELEQWHNLPQRAAMATRLSALATAGLLAPVLELVLDADGRAADTADAERAVAVLAAINRQLISMDANDRLRFANARDFGNAITGAIGLIALILVIMSVLVR